jgi:hypothetical protein
MEPPAVDTANCLQSSYLINNSASLKQQQQLLYVNEVSDF